MNPASTQTLAGLRDIHLPAPVSFWPLAPGWWLVIAAILVTGLAITLFMRARRRSLKRAALRELDGIARTFRADADARAVANAISALLRRVALARHPRREVASLHGADWSRFLLESCHGVGLDEAILRDLTTFVYAGPHATDDSSRVEVWIDGTRRWIGGNA
jgi:hypothetical protein